MMINLIFRNHSILINNHTPNKCTNQSLSERNAINQLHWFTFSNFVNKCPLVVLVKILEIHKIQFKI